MRFSTSTTLALAAAASAQTFTDCDPTKKTCPKDVGLPATTFVSDFKSGSEANASWSAAAYSTISYGGNGAEFSIANAKQAPTIETDFNIFFGRIDITMKAAKGQGIVSSIVLESADLDEIDWEFIGSDNAQVQSNFYGKGNTTTYDRVVYHPVNAPTDTFHTYSMDWTAERLQFLIDGAVVRTVQYSDPKALYGKNYPQTPAKLKLGNWCGGCGENEGTVEWAGGKASFGGSPYVMYVESVNIKNYNPADSYEWTDRSGSWESIKIINDGSSKPPVGGQNGGSTATGSTSAPTASHSVGNIHISHTPSATVTGYPQTSNGGKPTGAYSNGSGSEGSGAGSDNGAYGGNAGGHGGMGSDNCTETGSGAGVFPTGGYGSGAGAGSGSGGAGSTFTSLTVVGPTATTQYTGSWPSGTGSAPGGGANGTIATPSGPAQQTGNAASSLVIGSGSLVGMVFGLLFL